MPSKKPKHQSSSRRRKANCLTGQPYCQLENRNMLTITLVDGIVEVEGTLGDDVVNVDPAATEQSFTVTLNGESETFAVEDVLRVRFRGRMGNDVFTNTTDVDSTAYGHDGDDVFIGGGGHNRFQGGDGRDELIGGPRNDVIRGRDGNDIIFGGQRHDLLLGGDGSDEINGQQGRDVINGEAGNDILNGGNLEDEIRGEGGDDIIRGGTGDDNLIGGGGDDQIEGGQGKDVLVGNGGDDSLDGGAENDELRGGAGADILSGGDGADLINGHEGDDLIVGSNGRDTINAGDGNDRVFGGDGPDVIDGGAGNDELHGNEDVDVISGGDGSDRMFGGIDNNIFFGEGGRDIVLSASNADSIVDSGQDIVIKFGQFSLNTPGSRWTEEQIQTVEGALNQLVERTGSLDIIGDNNGDNMVRYLKNTGAIPGNDRKDGELVITLADWDSANVDQQRATTTEVFHQVGRLWSDAATIDAVFSGSGVFVTQFRQISDWTAGTDVPPGYLASTDGEWYYLEGAEFYTERGRENPNADWANIWEFVFEDMKDPVDESRLAAKTGAVETFFDSLAP